MAIPDHGGTVVVEDKENKEREAQLCSNIARNRENLERNFWKDKLGLMSAIYR